ELVSAPFERLQVIVRQLGPANLRRAAKLFPISANLIPIHLGIPFLAAAKERRALGSPRVQRDPCQREEGGKWARASRKVGVRGCCAFLQTKRFATPEAKRSPASSFEERGSVRWARSGRSLGPRAAHGAHFFWLKALVPA